MVASAEVVHIADETGRVSMFPSLLAFAENSAGLAYTLLVGVIVPRCDVDDVFPRSQDEQRLEPAIAHWPLLLRK